MTSPLKLGQRLNDRYLIQLDLGHGRFSRDYLANDTHRFDEPCTVKAFFSDAGNNGRNLFQQQATMLYGLDHPQIVNFREFFAWEDGLYLVQDFVEGQSYRDLLNLRRTKGKAFTELEVRQWWEQLLPVLAYLQNQGINHGALDLGNIVRRAGDNLPVLVDFSYAQYSSGDREKDLQDLHSLGLGTVTLITAMAQPSPPWENLLAPIPLSGEFRSLLLAVLESPPAVDLNTLIQNLSNLPQYFLPTVATDRPVSTMDEVQTDLPALAVTEDLLKGPASEFNNQRDFPFPSSAMQTTMVKVQGWKGFFKKLLLLFGLMAIAMGLGWGAGQVWLKVQQRAALKAEEEKTATPVKTDLEIKNEIRTRRLNLGIPPQLFQQFVDDALALQLGVDLNTREENGENNLPLGSPEQQMAMTSTLLDTLESLSPEAMGDLLQNNSGNRRRWIPQVNQLRLSSRSFNDLVNVRFRYQLPMVSGTVLEDQEFEQRPLALIWNAMAFDSLASLEGETHYQRINFDGTNQLSLTGELKPGEGYAYAVSIPPTEKFSLQLSAPPSTRISFYPPTGQEKMLENSTTHQWSGPANETGYYELVITTDAQEAIAFKLDLQVTPNSIFPE